jgi:DNA polymerase beta
MNENILINLSLLYENYRKDPSKKFQAKAIQNGIRVIENFGEEITNTTEFLNKCKERGIKGIGKGIIERIEEILLTQQLSECSHYVENEKDKVCELFKTITGVGDRKADEWYELGYRTIEDIYLGYEEGKIELTHHIKMGLKYYQDLLLRIPRDEIDKMKKKIQKSISKIDKKIVFEICGSYRRGESTSGDIDIILSHPDYITNIEEVIHLQRIVEKFVQDGIIIDHLTENGNKKYMGFCRYSSRTPARRIDIRLFNYEHYWAGILYFTGNKNFNILIRNRAIEKGYSLNEYSLTRIYVDEETYEKKKEIILLHSEMEIFQLLDLEYMTPEQRVI